MVNTKLLLFLVLAVIVVTIIECKERGKSGTSGGRISNSRGSHSKGKPKSGKITHHNPPSPGRSGHGSGRLRTRTKKPYRPKRPPPVPSGHGSGKSHIYPSTPVPPGHGLGKSHAYPSSPIPPGHGSGKSHIYPSTPVPSETKHLPAYNSPQHVYVTQYENSDSRYSHLLAGLTLYNLGRSQGQHHHHYYSDEYYRKSVHHNTNSAAGKTDKAPKEEATCFLRMKKDNQEDIIKIPCAIVSTFDNGDPQVEDIKMISNKTSTSCSSALSKTLNNTLIGNGTNLNATANVNETSSNTTDLRGNSTVDVEENEKDILKIARAIVSTFDNGAGALELKDTYISRNKTSYTCFRVLNTTLNNVLTSNETNLNATVNVNETSSNTTVLCGNSTVDVEDPLAAKGAPVDVNNTECSVEIRVKVEGQNKLKVIRNKVDCKFLLQQAKTPVPKKKNSIIPPEIQKSMPPWLAQYIDNEDFSVSV